MHFPGQHDGETVKFLVRKHWIIDLKIALMILVLYALPLMVLVSFIVAYWPKFSSITVVISLLIMLFAELYIYIKWLNEELDLIIITNIRVINLDQVSFMERTVSETTLMQIQDVKGVERGVLGNLLNYGDLEIQTAAEKIVFKIKNIPYPFETARRILTIRNEVLNHKQSWQTH